MKRPIKVAILVILGTALVVISHITTSYDRSDMASLEKLLGYLLLLLAAGLCLVKLADPSEDKPVKEAASAEVPHQAPPADPAPPPEKK